MHLPPDQIPSSSRSFPGGQEPLCSQLNLGPSRLFPVHFHSDSCANMETWQYMLLGLLHTRDHLRCVVRQLALFT